MTADPRAAAAGGEAVEPTTANAAEPEPDDGAAGPADDAPEELPAVEELVKQLRPEVLATMEELFRARWSGVKRLRSEDLPPP